MLPLDDIVVEEGEKEVEDDTAPDSDVVPDSPVRGIQSNLSCNHNDEDSSHDRTKEIVISQDQTIIICLVMVSSWSTNIILWRIIIKARVCTVNTRL